MPVHPVGLATRTDAPCDQAILPARVKIGQEDGDRLADEPTAVDHEPEPAEGQPRVFEIEQFGGGQVYGNLLVVPFPAGCLTFI